MYNQSFEGDVCSHKRAFFLDNFIRRLFQNPKKIVGPYIKPGDTVVDMGCGPGFFSIEMAHMVGETGQIFAVDLQKEMLAKVAHKAALKNLSDRVYLHLASQEKIGLGTDVVANFILAYYMVHEALDPNAFFSEAQTILSPQGKILVVEPPFHVSSKKFKEITRSAEDAGFRVKDWPKKKGGKSILLIKAS